MRFCESNEIFSMQFLLSKTAAWKKMSNLPEVVAEHVESLWNLYILCIINDSYKYAVRKFLDFSF